MTPSEWLLAEHDREANNPGRVSRAGRERVLAEVLHDHAAEECRPMGPVCRDDQGAASWPRPFESQDLDVHDAYLGRAA